MYYTDIELLELTGNETVDDLESWFGGQSYEYILDEVNRCYTARYQQRKL